MKSKGFRKVGKYEYGTTFDRAVYKRQEQELQVIYTVHPYDYPNHGINTEIRIDGEVKQSRYYSFETGNLNSLVRQLAQDIVDGVICI